MPKTKKSKATRRLNKLLAAKIHPEVARKLSHLPWTEIHKEVSKSIPNIPEASSTPCNEHTSKMGVQGEPLLSERLSRASASSLRRECSETLQTSPKKDISLNNLGTAKQNKKKRVRKRKKSLTSQGFFLHQLYGAPQTCNAEVVLANYWEAAGLSQDRGCYETYLQTPPPKEIENIEPPNKTMKYSQIDGALAINFETADSSSRKHQRDATPLECSTIYSYERDAQLKYIDTNNDGLQVLDDGAGPRNETLPTPQVISVDDDSNYEDPDCQLLIGPRNDTQPTSRAISVNDDSDYEDPDCTLLIGPQNDTHPTPQAISVDDDSDYEDPDCPLPVGPRNETHPTPRAISVNDDSDYKNPDCPLPVKPRNETNLTPRANSVDDDSDYSRSGSYEPHTPSMHSDYSEDADPSRCLHIESKSKETSFSNQPSMTREPFAAEVANLNEVAEPIRVGICNVTQMTKKQMVLVHRSINQAIVRISEPGGGPKFLGCTYEVGGMLMNCENHKSRKWLEGEVPKLKPWPGASLSVTLEDELPNQILVSFLIPTKEGVTISTALKLLQVQNSGLNTGTWKVIKVYNRKAGPVLLLSIDEASYEALRLVKFRANLGTDKVTFWVRSGPTTPLPLRSTKQITAINSDNNQILTASVTDTPSKSPHQTSSLKKPLGEYFVPSSAHEERQTNSGAGENSSMMKGSSQNRRGILGETLSTQNSQAEDEPSHNLPPSLEALRKWYPIADHSYSSSD